MNLSRVKAILFDYGGTLDSDGMVWKDHFYAIYKREGFRWKKEDFNRFFYVSDDFLTDTKLYKTPYFRTLFRQASLLLKEAGAYKEALARRVAHRFLDDSLKTLKRNVPLLKQLKRKYRLGIVSNFYGNLPALCKETGLSELFDVIADSGRVGYTKPDPRIFRYALKAVKAGPKEALFVGDSVKRDMRGAKGIGMPHIWIKGPLSGHLKICCKTDTIIRSLPELKEILL